MLLAGGRDEVARRLAALAAEAGDVLNRYRSGPCGQKQKTDGSPVSDADLAAESLLVAALAVEFPQWPVISEENALSHDMAPQGSFFLVDPLDGTKAFLAGAPDFCVLIALIEDGVPIASAIHAPATGQSWWAGATASKACDRVFTEVERLTPRPVRAGGPVAIISSQHAGAQSRILCDKLHVARVICENSGLKFARLAEGEADVYPRIGRTMQWDIAAGDGLLRALGGIVLDLAGRPLRYGAHGSATGHASGSAWGNPDFVAYRLQDDQREMDRS
jgi:3'(2'), 5'-bisphosphate nucleotidase